MGVCDYTRTHLSPMDYHHHDPPLSLPHLLASFIRLSDHVMSCHVFFCISLHRFPLQIRIHRAIISHHPERASERHYD